MRHQILTGVTNEQRAQGTSEVQKHTGGDRQAKTQDGNIEWKHKGEIKILW